MQVEKVEKNKVKMTFEVDSVRFEEGMNHSYQQNRSKFVIPGFRKGKVPRKMLEMQYGKEIFFEDAINYVLEEAYIDASREASKENGLTFVSRPEIDIERVSAEEGVVFTAEVFTKPEVTVSGYTGLACPKADTVVTNEDIDSEIERTREKNARLMSVTDRPAQMGDVVTIDFEGFIGDEPFEGGKAENYSLTLGSDTFIPGFEVQIAGHEVGEGFDVSVTFPETYHAEDLRGADAVFRVTLNDIQHKELPELDDEFAQDVSEFDTLEEYRADVAKQLQEMKENTVKQQKEEAVIKALIGVAEMDVPPVMIETRLQEIFNDYLRRISESGFSVEGYFRATNQSPEAVRETFREEAVKNVQGRLALEAVAAAENIEATEEEAMEEAVRLAEALGMEPDKFKEVLSPEDAEALKQDICVRKALDFVLEHAVETDMPEVEALEGEVID